LTSVRTDKPTPYVQAVENAQVVHKSVALGARGTADGVEVVAVTGVNDGALVIRGNVGSLREGTQVRFTAMNAPALAANPAASGAKSAP